LSQLKRGVLLSYLNIFLTNVLGLLITPFMVHRLGNSEYGLYMLVGSLISYIGILDFGLSSTIIRFVAKHRAEKRKKEEENFLATVMLIYTIISAIIVLSGIAIYFNLGSIFKKLSIAELHEVRIMFAILILNLAVTLPGGVFTGICSAYEQFVFPNALSILKYIVRSFILVIILLSGGTVISIVVLDTIVNLITIFLSMYYVFTKLDVVFKLHKFQKSIVIQIFSFSVWIFIFSLVSQFQWRSGQIILGIVSGATAVAIYGVGIMLGSYYGVFSTAISDVFLPRATTMIVSSATNHELTSMMIRIGRFSLIFLLMILGGFVLYGDQFVNLWLGPTYHDSWIIALIIMLTYTVPLVQSFANSVLEAKNKFAFKAKTYIILIVAGTCLGYYLVRYFGTIGIIIGTSAGWLSSQIILNIYYQKVIKLEILRFFKELFNRLLLVFLLVLVIGYAFNYIPGNNWAIFSIKVSLYLAVFFSLMFYYGLNIYEIKMFKELIPVFSNRNRHDLPE